MHLSWRPRSRDAHRHSPAIGGGRRPWEAEAPGPGSTGTRPQGAAACAWEPRAELPGAHRRNQARGWEDGLRPRVDSKGPTAGRPGEEPTDLQLPPGPGLRPHCQQALQQAACSWPPPMAAPAWAPLGPATCPREPRERAQPIPTGSSQCRGHRGRGQVCTGHGRRAPAVQGVSGSAVRGTGVWWGRRRSSCRVPRGQPGPWDGGRQPEAGVCQQPESWGDGGAPELLSPASRRLAVVSSVCPRPSEWWPGASCMAASLAATVTLCPLLAAEARDSGPPRGSRSRLA